MKRIIHLLFVSFGIIALVACGSVTTEGTDENTDSLDLESVFDTIEKELGSDINTIIDTIEKDSIATDTIE